MSNDPLDLDVAIDVRRGARMVLEQLRPEHLAEVKRTLADFVSGSAPGLAARVRTIKVGRDEETVLETPSGYRLFLTGAKEKRALVDIASKAQIDSLRMDAEKLTA